MSIFLEGPTALIVSSAIDPDNMLAEWAKLGFVPKLWVAKLTGTDTGGDTEINHCFDVARSHGLHVGGWIQCGNEPRADLASIDPWLPKLDLIEFCCEIEYKSNATPPNNQSFRADTLACQASYITIPKAVITYGRHDTAMRMEAFRDAGWDVVPECYQDFALADADSYYPMFLGRNIHPLVHTFDRMTYRGNRVGVYRPEGLL